MGIEWFGLAIVALGVGVAVGITGMGGGALMTPALILLGVPPANAIANDLVAAAVTKSIAARAHLRLGTPHLTIVGLLMIGSLPMAGVGVFLAHRWGVTEAGSQQLRCAVGAALLLSAGAYILRSRYRLSSGRPCDGPASPRPVLTILLGAVGGLLVGMTSVGAGSVMMIFLVLLYPRLTPKQVVGTDLAQAVPLVACAATGHVLAQGVQPSLLIPLILGGSAGTLLGSRISARVPQNFVRTALVGVLTVTGASMLQIPHLWSLALAAAALLILGVTVRRHTPEGAPNPG